MSAWSKTKEYASAAWKGTKATWRSFKKGASKFPYWTAGGIVAAVFGVCLLGAGIALMATAPVTFGGGAVAGGLLIGLSGGLVGGAVCVVFGLACLGGGIAIALQTIRKNKMRADAQARAKMASDINIASENYNDSQPRKNSSLSQHVEVKSSKDKPTSPSNRKVTFSEKDEVHIIPANKPKPAPKKEKAEEIPLVNEKGVFEKLFSIFSSKKSSAKEKKEKNTESEHQRPHS